MNRQAVSFKFLHGIVIPVRVIQKNSRTLLVYARNCVFKSELTQRRRKLLREIEVSSVAPLTYKKLLLVFPFFFPFPFFIHKCTRAAIQSLISGFLETRVWPFTRSNFLAATKMRVSPDEVDRGNVRLPRVESSFLSFFLRFVSSIDFKERDAS